MRAANINPRTGLATDYLNHFNEAIMLLEMVPDMPECAEDFLTWSPLSYCEHFMASNFKARELAIEAYEAADAKIRAEFDNITSTIKARRAGFHDCIDTEDMFTEFFDQTRAAGVIPPKNA